MDEKLPHSDLPDLRKFLDDLPIKPCPSKLPEEYCKICNRLNKDVANYCKTKKLPERPKEKDISEEELPTKDIPLSRLEPIEEEEGREELKPVPPIGKRNPILDRPSYRDGDTSLEFVSSKRAIDEARKSLPRFIPVNRGPRTFRPLDDEPEMEFETFSLSRSSIFKEPSLLSYEEDDMMFSLAVDEDAIEVMPVEVISEGQYEGETVFSSADGIVEVVDVPDEEGLQTFEEDVPAFEFMPQDEGEFLDVEIIEAEVLEDEPIFESFTTEDTGPGRRSEMQQLADEITGMTESLEAEFAREDLAFTPDTPGDGEAEPKFAITPGKEKKTKKKLRPKKSMKRKIKKLKRKEASEPEVEEPSFTPQTEELPEATLEDEPTFETHSLESSDMDLGAPVEGTPQDLEGPAFVAQEEVPKKKSKKKMKLKIKTKVKKSKKEETPLEEVISEPEFKAEEPALEPEPDFFEDEPLPETAKEPLPEIDISEPAEDETFYETELEEPILETEEAEPVAGEPLIEESVLGSEPEPELVEDGPFPDPGDEPFPVTDSEELGLNEEEPAAEELASEPEIVEDEPFPETEFHEPAEGPLFTPLLEETISDEEATEPEVPQEEQEGGSADLYMCPSCGAFVSGSASVCIKCGYDFEAEENGDVAEPAAEEPPFEPFDEEPAPEAQGELPTEYLEPQGAEPEMEFTQDEPEGEKKEGEEGKPKKKKKKVKLKKKKKVKLKKVKKKNSED